MRIALDAMGGDNAPGEIIKGAIEAAETLDADDVKVILQGGELDKPTVGDLLAAEQAKDQENEKRKTKNAKP